MLQISPANILSARNNDHDLDNAFNYIQNIDNPDLDTESVDLRGLRRKIDWHILPIMFVCYVMQYMDKVSINVSLPRLFNQHTLTLLSMQR